MRRFLTELHCIRQTVLGFAYHHHHHHQEHTSYIHRSAMYKGVTGDSVSICISTRQSGQISSQFSNFVYGDAELLPAMFVKVFQLFGMV